jgi:hypothetical protein
MRRPAGRGRDAPSAGEVSGERPPKLRAAAGIAGGDGAGTGTLEGPAGRMLPGEAREARSRRRRFRLEGRRHSGLS